MRRPPVTTMSSSFHTHGLIGIDLHHVQAERARTFERANRQSPLSAIRHALAAVFISAGTRLVGNETAPAHSTEYRPAS